jgi:hypothetical protein
MYDRSFVRRIIFLGVWICLAAVLFIPYEIAQASDEADSA